MRVQSGESVNPADTFYAHWGFIQSEIRRRFPRQETLAEEALNYVHEKCAEDGWSKITQYQGRSSFKTFLRAVTLRLVEDFSRQRFGRRRPPAWVRLKGGFWERLYRLLCLEGLSRDAAAETLEARSPGKPGRKAALTAGRTILENIPDCGAQSPRETPLEETEPQPDPHDCNEHLKSPEDLLAIKERSAFLQAVRLCLELPEDFPAQSDADQLRRFLHALRTRMRLSAEERLLLRLVYQDDLNVTKAGALLGLGQDQAHGRLRRLLGRLREAIRAALVSLGEDPETSPLLRIAKRA